MDPECPPGPWLFLRPRGTEGGDDADSDDRRARGFSGSTLPLPEPPSGAPPGSDPGPCAPRSFAKPPKQVQTVCECILIMKGYRELNWKTAKGMMSDPNFLRSLMELDFDSISQSQVKNIKGACVLRRGEGRPAGRAGQVSRGVGRPAGWLPMRSGVFLSSVSWPGALRLASRSPGDGHHPVSPAPLGGGAPVPSRRLVSLGLLLSGQHLSSVCAALGCIPGTS